MNLRPNTVIVVSKGYLLEDEERDYIWHYELNAVTKSNHKAILSSCWYLSLKSTRSPDWSEYYECEPNSFIGTQEKNNLVIGGEVWTEFVDTNTLISRLWFVFENYKF